MTIWPLQFRQIDSDEFLFSDDSGAFFKADEAFLERYIASDVTAADDLFLKRHGHTYDGLHDPSFMGFTTRWLKSVNPVRQLSYVILVPTLRCNLMCDYCQVSRAAETAKGFDWDDKQLDQVIALLDAQETSMLKVEFQGGEPLLRLDLLDAIRSFCRSRFTEVEFVVCTNLQNVSEDAWNFLQAPDTFISTSFDGTSELHRRQRTKGAENHDKFSRNLNYALQLIGPDRVSALPTIDPLAPPEPEEVIEAFAELGLTSVFLRRINYQGFARKKYGFDRSLDAWLAYYRRFIRALIEYNSTAEVPLEEFYMSHILRRILRGGHNGHVDLRNPNWLATDYLVVDFDGTFYPTDEARMVSRVGQVDLSIGSLRDGIDRMKVDALNQNVSNFDDPDCMHCAYKAYCGLDPIDDLSRYGRIDMPRHQTEHCKSHLAQFDLAFELIYSEDVKVHKSLVAWLDLPRFSSSLAPRLS